MIKFKTLRWRNFLSTGNAFTEVHLDKTDNTLIVGENGAGKSTILDALCYALFGTPFRNINIPTLLNSINKGDLLVELEFNVGSHKYEIKRGIKPNIFEIYHNNKLIDQAAKKGDYQDYLENYILHFNKKTFTQVGILGNANFVPFMQLKAADRRAVIEDILDIQVFSVMNKLLNERLKALKDDLLENRHQHDLAQTEVKIKTTHIEKLKKDKQKEIEENQEKINNTNIQIKDCQEKVNKNNDKILELRTTIESKQDVVNKLQTAHNYFNKINDKLDKNKKDMDFWSETTKCPTCSEDISKEKAEQKKEEIHKCVIEYNEGLEKLNKMISSLDNKVKRFNDLENQITVLNNENSKKLSEIRIFMSLVMEYEAKKIELSKEQVNLEDEIKDLMLLETKVIDLDKKRSKLLDDQVYFEITTQLLKDSGIKTKIIKQYLPVINKLVNKYLAEMDFFVNFELDENFKETIKSRHRDQFSYENFSEGEKQRIDMALMLTWREVAKLKNSAATNVLILDEIFDSSLDGNGIEYLMNILHSLEKCNLFVISHKGDVLQDKFKSVIRFEKQGNYSRIV